MTSGTVSFEINDTECNLRLELDLGGPAHLYSGFLQLVTLAMTGLDGDTPPPVEAPAPVTEDPLVPSPEVPEPEPEPVTFTVDPPEPEPSSSNGSGSTSPTAEILGLLAEAGGELSDAEGRVAAKIRDITGLADKAVSNALTRLRDRGLILSSTTGRRTSRVTLTLAGWEAAGSPAPMDAPAASADHHQRMRDRAAEAVGGTPGSGRRFEARR
jgi:DNA-binding MarR family transcriptional regulator